MTIEMPPRKFCFDLAGQRIVLLTNHPDIFNMVEIAFPHYDIVDTAANMEVQSSSGINSIILHSYYGRYIETVSESDLLFKTCVAIEDTICDCYNKQGTPYCALHAGCISLCGKHIVFLEHKHHGKSTLISHLSRNHKAIYASDDILFLTHVGLYNVPLPIRLRNRCVDGQQICDNETTIMYKNETRYFYMPPEIHTIIPFHADIIILPEYAANQPASISKLNKIDGFRKVIENLKKWSSEKDVFSLVNQIVKEANIFHIRYGFIQDAADSIHSIINDT